MLDYIIFFSLIGLSLVIFILSLFQGNIPSGNRNSRNKCESYIERKLYDALVFNGYVVHTQVKCGKYRIDLALMNPRIAIECDGRAYHSSLQQKVHDRRKNEYLRQSGWRVLRFGGSLIHRDVTSVVRRIEDEIRQMKKAPDP